MDNFDEKLDRALNKWGAPKEVLSEIVDSYINNELGSNTSQEENENGSLDNTASCNCEETISAMQLQIDELTQSIEQNTNKLNLLLNKLYDNAAVYKTPYEQIDPTILFRTYDFIEKKVNFTFTTNHTCCAYFLNCYNCSESTLKVYLTLNAVNDGTGSVIMYVNGTKLEDVKYFEVVAGVQTLEFTYNLELLETGNHFEPYVYTDKSNQLNITKIKLEAFNCTNPTFVKYETAYNVDYWGGLYYITNCSGKTAKYAIVDPATLNTINDIVWVDTGIEASIYRFYTNAVLSGGMYKHGPISNFYLTRDHKLIVNDSSSNKTYTNNKVLMADPAIPQTNSPSVAATIMNGRIIYAQIFRFSSSGSQTVSYINRESLYAAAYEPKYFFKETTSVTDIVGYVLQSRQNEVITSFRSQLANLGYGTYISSYLINAKPYVLEVYVKVHDYMVKHTVTYSLTDYSANHESTVSEVIGKYDYYFKGINDDYFTVTNGVLNYYKKDFTEDPIETTTE